MDSVEADDVDCFLGCHDLVAAKVNLRICGEDGDVNCGCFGF